jgi:hypothetical protein
MVMIQKRSDDDKILLEWLDKLSGFKTLWKKNDADKYEKVFSWTPSISKCLGIETNISVVALHHMMNLWITDQEEEMSKNNIAIYYNNEI